MRKIYLIVLLFIAGNLLFSQVSFLEKGKNYSFAKVYPKDKMVFKVRNLQLLNDTTIAFYNMNTSADGTLKNYEVNSVSVKQGSYAAIYGASGALIGLLSSLLAVAQVKTDPYLDDSNADYTPIVIGFTVGCGAIGAVIGALSPKWKRLYMPEKPMSGRIIVNPNLSYKYYGVQLVYHF